jgi:hypothetical protein
MQFGDLAVATIGRLAPPRSPQLLKRPAIALPRCLRQYVRCDVY